jgi:hypothetical protein
MRKLPFAPVCTVRLNPVSRFDAVTLASGIAAPLASVTAPPRLAVVYCDQPAAERPESKLRRVRRRLPNFGWYASLTSSYLVLKM